jgi:hypothetical protein
VEIGKVIEEDKLIQ